MGFISGLIDVVDHLGRRLITPNSLGRYQPVRLKLWPGASTTCVDRGDGTSELQIAAPSDVLSYATSADFRVATPPADGTFFRVVSPAGEYRYSTSSGAGWADDNDTILKPDSVLIGSNGRAFSTRASAHAATFTAARSMKGLVVSGIRHVHIESHTAFGDGGGGVFDVKATSSDPDDDGNVLQATAGVFLIRRDRQTATRSGWAGGITQAAIDLTPSGGMLILPPGTFLARGLTISKPMRLVGENTTLKVDSAIAGTAPLFTVSSDGVSFEGITFDGDRFNQTGSRGDNILLHRQHSAISTAEISCDDTQLIRCVFKNFYNSAVCHIGDRFKATVCTFQDSNSAPLIIGYHSSDNTIHSNDIQITGCTFERTGYRTGPSDTREFGNSLPTVTGDAILLRASNAIVSNNTFLETDRCSVKVEHIRENLTIRGNIHVNSYAGDSSYSAIGIQADAADFVASASNRNNLVIADEIVRRPTGLFGVTLAHIFGLSIRGCDVYIPSGVGAEATIALDAASYVTITDCSLVSAIAVPCVKTVSTGALTRNYYNIVNNRMETAAGFGVLVVGTLNKFRMRGNSIISATNGLYGDTGTFDDFIISDNEMRDIRFVTGAASTRTNFLVERNLFEGYVESYIQSATCRDNLTKTTATGRTLIGLVSAAAGAYFPSGSSGEMAVLPIDDTTPSVKGHTSFVTANTVATSITTFDDPVVGVPFLIVFRDANTTLVNSATLRLVGGVDFVGTDYDTMVLVYVYGVGFIELSRSVT